MIEDQLVQTKLKLEQLSEEFQTQVSLNNKKMNDLYSKLNDYALIVEAQKKETKKHKQMGKRK